MKPFLILVLLPIAFHVSSQEKISFLFESGDYKTPTSSLDELNKLNNVESIDSIIAYCDTVGSVQMNLKLANQRLQTILSALPDSNKVKIKLAKGENYAVNKNNYSKAQWRRVDVYYSITSNIQNRIEPINAIAKQQEKILTLQDITQENIDQGNIPLIELRIEFLPGSFILTEGSKFELEELALFLKQYPVLNATIRGHVCCMSDQPLSEARARAVAIELLNRGIQKNRLTTIGLSNSDPKISPEISEEDKQRNRRVDVLFTKIETRTN